MTAIEIPNEVKRLIKERYRDPDSEGDRNPTSLSNALRDD